MPLFNVIVEVKTVYYSNIVVEAKDYPSAMGFCKNNIDWQGDENLEVPNAGGYHKEYKLKETRPIDEIHDVPDGYRRSAIPWNSISGMTIDDYLKHEDTDNLQGDRI